MLDYLKYDKKILSTPIGAEGLDIADNPKVTVAKLPQFSKFLNGLARL
jgi:hypothetical protein